MTYDNKARERSHELIALDAYISVTITDLEDIFGIKIESDVDLMALFVHLKEVLKRRIVLKDE